jgi:flavin reductase (DIM6/NTAB) family NADH-FMN oxidoreductase RutF
VAGSPDDLPPEFELPMWGAFGAGAPEGIGEVPFEEVAEPEPMDIGDPEGDPAVELRRTMGMFATGVTIVTTKSGDQLHGMTANAFMSVSLRPPLVLVSVDRRAKMHQLLRVGVTYGVNVLGEEQHDLSDRFAGRAGGEGVEPQFGFVRDTPLVEGAVAHVVARVVQTYWGGDHALFLGQVEYARYGQGRPLLFHGGRYEHLRLAEAPLFAALSPEMRDRILAAGEERRYAKGETVVREGQPGDDLFVILDGSARVERGGRVLSRFAPGEFFGELSVLDGRLRSADVVADSPLRCLAVPREALRDALLAEPSAAWEMLSLLAGRVRES